MEMEADMSVLPRGIYVIVPTPFDQALAIDFEALRRIVRFNIECGVAGVVATANGSEVGYLADSERRRVAEIVVEEAKGRVVTVVGISSSCWPISRDLAVHAEKIGADAVMAMPPGFQRPNEAEIRTYYAAIDKASSLPIFLQNFSGPGGTPMSSRLMAELMRDLPNVKYVKEETESSSVLISEIIAAAKSNLCGVMGGMAGRALIDEHRRGVCGTMPASDLADIHVALWNALEAGNQEKANEIFRLLLPFLNFKIAYGPVMYKEVLRRRGVIESSAFRQTGARILDAFAQQELDNILSALAPMMERGYQASR
jgi:dihydrodipicolinate synthase/N-acetylneuraminate lyase